MQPIGNIDPLSNGRTPLTEVQQKWLIQERQRQEKYSGYQQLTELCLLGEFDIAIRLANRHSVWGYEIVNGVVVDRVD